MKDHRQEIFAQQLLNLFSLRKDYLEDCKDVEKAEIWVKEFRKFINYWCPTFKEFEEY